MDACTPALRAARALTRITGAPLLPVDGEPPVDAGGAVLLVDSVPSDQLLAGLAGVLPSAAALVIWAPGWDQAAALAALAPHGFEHGSVDIVVSPAPGALCVLAATEAAAAALAPALKSSRQPFRALAVMPAFNEADVIFHAIGALVAAGIDVYLIDHESTDATAEAAAPWLGRGLVHIERFPEDAGYPERNRREMVWRDILRRVQEVTGEVPADWYLFVNADEFRESPWPGVTLADGMREADELGYNAVNFELFDFRPTDDQFTAGSDPRDHLRHYEPPGRHDLLQIKAWKRQAQPVDLVHHGGHDLIFEGKRVFPVPFILRHYPIRSSEHGARKVHQERLARFAAEERADGWHVQYDGYVDRGQYLHDSATLTEWDGERVRSEVLARALRQLLLALCLAGGDPSRSDLQLPLLDGWLARRGTSGSGASEVQAAQERLVAVARGAALLPVPQLDRVAGELSLALEAQARLRGDVVTAALLGDAREALAQAA